VKDRTDISDEQFEFAESAENEYPRFAHVSSRIPFQYVPGGSFMMGFPEEEESVALAISDVLQFNFEEMRLARRWIVHPMLAHVTPVLNSRYFKWKIELPKLSSLPSCENEKRLASWSGCRLPISH